MANAIWDEGAKVNSTINVTPMVDVILVLLIVFMVITPLLHPGPIIQLVNASNPRQMPDADKEDVLLVAISREGQVFLGNEKMSPAALTQTIRDRIAGRTNQMVFVKADARSRYRTVAEVVENVRSAGVSELGLLTERKSQ
jgi:biopolymer transport protein TolR